MGKKWDPDATPTEKLLALYTLLLFTGREASLSELSRELQCPKQTVSRLMNALEASRFGKLLRVKKGREVLYQLDRPRHLPKISLNAEGLYQLALCRDFLLHLLPDAMRKNVDTTLQQASAFLPEGGSLPESIGQSFVKGHINYTPFQSILGTLMQAIREHKICVLSYQATLSKEQHTYEYAPKRIVAFHGALYLAGWIVSEKGTPQAIYDSPTILALHRVRMATLTRILARHLPEPEEESQGQETFGLMKATPFTAKIRFDKSAATYVAERKWSDGQKIVPHKDGSMTLTVVARSPEELLSWVLGFGKTAEVLAPKWLRENVIQAVNDLSALYGKKRQYLGENQP